MRFAVKRFFYYYLYQIARDYSSGVASSPLLTYRSFAAYDPRVVGDVLILSLFDEGGDDDDDGDKEQHDDEPDDPTGSGQRTTAFTRSQETLRRRFL